MFREKKKRGKFTKIKNKESSQRSEAKKQFNNKTCSRSGKWEIGVTITCLSFGLEQFQSLVLECLKQFHGGLSAASCKIEELEGGSS